ncbi:hypothetical protein [Chryseobacterium indoltheticum]|uniref:hypothetical protein n=1 Tax=Chryseobacterium indoltheticum TaxID=254 RepID=UPI0028E87E52|nr:hypothetical protein [Chryseobacterium indoltheticum]
MIDNKQRFWNYYLSLEEDFIKISRYVDFDIKNSKTFSIEFARIIMTCCQEIDGLLKLICERLDPDKPRNNIANYFEILKVSLNELKDFEVDSIKYGLTSKPFIDLSSAEHKSPDWWLANNKIKHDRINNFEEANLTNAYNAISALYIIVLFYYKVYDENGQEIYLIKRDLIPESQLFIEQISGIGTFSE